MDDHVLRSPVCARPLDCILARLQNAATNRSTVLFTNRSYRLAEEVENRSQVSEAEIENFAVGP
jgi:hypothetical protein